VLSDAFKRYLQASACIEVYVRNIRTLFTDRLFSLMAFGALGSVTMMNKTMDDHLGEATGVKVTELLLPLQIEVRKNLGRSV